MNGQSDKLSQSSGGSLGSLGSKFGGYLSKLKQAIIRLTESPSLESASSNASETTNGGKDGGQREYAQSNEVDLVGPLPINFKVSEKRRRLSIQGHPTNDSIPRSLTRGVINPRRPSYLNIYNEIKTNEEESHNDLERRKSIIDSLIVPSQENSVLTSREESPALNMPLPKSTIEIDFSEGREGTNQDKPGEEKEEEYEQLQIVQIDPAERSRIVRLKRSMQDMELMRKRMKYMKSPNETTTIYHGDSTMVDTSTQTYNTDYLNSVLNFKKRSSSSTLENKRNKRRKKGFFLKEFVYDVEKPVNVVTSTTYKGYASELGKPKFKSNDDENASLGARPNRDGVSLGQKLSLSLDSDYLAKKQSLSDIIKIKEDSIKVPISGKNDVTTPSSGFRFNIDDKRISEVMGTLKEESGGETKGNKDFICGTETQKLSDKASASLFPFKLVTNDNTEKQKDGSPKASGITFGEKKDEKETTIDGKTEFSTTFSKGGTETNKAKSQEEKSPFPYKFGGSSAPTTNSSGLFGKTPIITTTQSEEGQGSKSGLFNIGASKSELFSGFGSKSSGGLFGRQQSDDKKKENGTAVDVNGAASGPTTNSLSFNFQPKTTSKDKKEESTMDEEADLKRKRTKPSDDDHETQGTNKTMADATSLSKSSTPVFAFSAMASESGEAESKKDFAAGVPADGTTKPPAFSFGFKPSSAATDNKEKSESPGSALTLGKSDFEKKEEEKKNSLAVPVFSFGKQTESTLGDGGKPPMSGFTFGKPAAESNSTDDKSKSLMSVFTFGKPADNNKPTSSSTFGFGFGNADDEAKSAPSAFSINKTEDQAKSESAPPASFSFGKAEEKAKSAGAPAFSFGQSAEKEKSTVPAFSFGQPAEKAKSAAPAFSFGKTSSTTSTAETQGKSPSPAFTLGKTTKEDNDQSKTFAAAGATTTSASPTPTPASTSGFGSTLGFSFGNTGTTGTTGTIASSASDKQQSTTMAPVSTSGFKFAPGVTPPPATTAPTGSTSLFGANASASASASGSNIAAPKPFNSSGFGGFGSQTQLQVQPPGASTTSTAPAFGSRPSTPSFHFGGSGGGSGSGGRGGEVTGQAHGNGLPPTSLIFGSATKLNKVPLFNFTGSKSGTPDPASIFGQHQPHAQQQLGSRESTPFGNGAPGGVSVPSFGFGQPQTQQQQQAQAQAQAQPQQQPFQFGASPAPQQPQGFGFGGGAPGGAPGAGGFAASTGAPQMSATTPQANPRRPRLLPRSRRR